MLSSSFATYLRSYFRQKNLNIESVMNVLINTIIVFSIVAICLAIFTNFPYISATGCLLFLLLMFAARND